MFWKACLGTLSKEYSLPKADSVLMFRWNLCEYIYTTLGNQRPICCNVSPVKFKYGSKDILLFYSSHLQPSRPLSWSYDSSQALSAQLTPNHTIPSTQSNYSLGWGSRGRPSPLASRPESPSHSVLGASNSKSSLVSSEGMDTTVCTNINRDNSCDAFEVKMSWTHNCKYINHYKKIIMRFCCMKTAKKICWL